MRLDIPNYPTIEAPMPEDMQQVINELRKQK
jgi:23S rRNA pseudouridine955/2504/2580 synthase